MAAGVRGPPPLRVSRQHAPEEDGASNAKPRIHRVGRNSASAEGGGQRQSMQSSRAGNLFIFGNDVDVGAYESMASASGTASRNPQAWPEDIRIDTSLLEPDSSWDPDATTSPDPESPHSGSTDTESITDTFLYRREAAPEPSSASASQSPRRDYWSREVLREDVVPETSAKTRESVAALLRSRQHQQGSETHHEEQIHQEAQRRPLVESPQRRHLVESPQATEGASIGGFPDTSGITEPEVEPLDTSMTQAGASTSQATPVLLSSSKAPGANGRRRGGTGDSESLLPEWKIRALDEAQGWAAQRCFAEAMQCVIPVLSGPRRATELLVGLCRSWEKADHEKTQRHEEALGRVTAELLQSAEEAETRHHLEEELDDERQKRDGAERRLQRNKDDAQRLMAELSQLRGRADDWRRLKEEKDVELASECRKVQELQREVTWLRRRSQVQDEALRENAHLKQQIRNMEAQSRAPTSPGQEEIIRKLVELECEPLRQCASDDRAALKKKILIKWHPDKQPSCDHVAFATQVTQELQNRPEWKSD